MRDLCLNMLVESHVGSSREAIKADLVDKIVYDDPSVFRRLRVPKVDNTFVAECTKSLKITRAEDINLLKTLAEAAAKKDTNDLEYAEILDTANDQNKGERSGNHGSLEEKNMYDPLIRLFGHITNFGQVTEHRTFQKTNVMLKPDEPHTFGFPSCSPDITITSHGVDPRKSKAWRDRDAFGEVKPSNKQRPKPAAELDAIPSIVSQSADYARVFLAARPSMLFCVGILIFGSEFCVGIFDRSGITFSPVHDMFQDTEVFVRVVRSLVCSLSIQELGLDPTICILTEAEAQRLTGTTATYPSAVVSRIGNDHRQWCTIGPPIWSSLSFLGRGTNVWRVREYVEAAHQRPVLQGDEMILKAAWRDSDRTPESDIYRSIRQPPEGLAKFVCGGDVMFAEYPITVRNLRSSVLGPLPEDSDPTPILHRLILSTVGRPIWEYTSDLDLLTGLRDALQAHKDLCNGGVLHRDISAGNVLLTKTQNGPLRGFITDLEFAHIEGPTLLKPKSTVTTTVGPQVKYNDSGRLIAIPPETNSTHTRIESSVVVKRGAGITGTAQFMALEILIHNGKTGHMTHEARHDVESFIWVLSYAVLRNLCHQASKPSTSQEIQDQYPALRTQFRTAFSQVTAANIAVQRTIVSPALRFSADEEVEAITTNFMSDPLVSLFRFLRTCVHRSQDPEAPTPLCHDILLNAVQDAIVALQSSTI